MLLRKLIELSSWNTLAAGINFLTNLLVVKIFGLDTFGELALIGSLSGIMSLVFIILPGNYAIMKYQDDKEFRYGFTAFYLLGLIVLFFLCLLFGRHSGIPTGLFFLFAGIFSLQGYFDVCLQAENKLRTYYLMLFAIAIAKASLVGAYYLLSFESTITGLIWTLVLAQGSVLLYMLIRRADTWYKSLAYIKRVPGIISRNFRQFISYYFNSGLKKVNANIIVLLFEPFVSKEVLGTYWLFIKVHQFVTGLVRTLESLSLNKQNLQYFKNRFQRNGILIAFVSQTFYVVIGTFYLWYLTGQYFLVYLLLLSLTMYPYVFFVKSRSRFLMEYKNGPINLSYILFLVVILIVFLFSQFPHNVSWLIIILSAFGIATLIQTVSLVIIDKISPSSGE